MENRIIPDKAFTHGGIFHADDVFSAALLQILNPSIKIERGFAIPESYNGLVFDIGNGEFDHHQADNEIRPNGIPYAAFGKLWRAFGNRVTSYRGQIAIEESLVQALDNTDNTGCYNPLSQAIKSFNPAWNSDIAATERFHEAVNFAKRILENIIETENSKDAVAELAQKVYNNAINKEIIVLTQFAPVASYLIDTEAKFIIYASDRGGYCIQAIGKRQDEFTSKIAFPEAWAASQNISDISGIPDLRFCHQKRWLARAESLDGAIKAALIALHGKDTWTIELNHYFTEIRDSLIMTSSMSLF